MAEFIDGPLWYFSLAVFLVGVVVKLARIAFASRPEDLSEARNSGYSGAMSSLLQRFAPAGDRRISSLPFIAGYLFHLGLLALIFFAAPHVVFLEEQLIGFGWTPMPRWAFIVSAQCAFFGLILLWLYRMLNPVSRLISTTGDHVSTILTFIVMLTGCLALLESFEALRLLHRFSVELFLIYFPFGSLMHSLTFIPSRILTGAWFGRRGVSL